MKHEDRLFLTGLRIPCIIGVFDRERKRKQDVLLDLEFPTDARRAARRDLIEEAVDYKKIAKAAIAFVQKSHFRLVETLAQKLADYLLERFRLQEIFLRVSKPGAVRGSKNVGVEITRRFMSPAGSRVFFSLGSNIDPSFHLNNALKELRRRFEVKAVSSVYETSPVKGGKKQPLFLNMAVAVETNETPQKIRRWIAWVEKTEGRERAKDPHAPRTLDVDLLIWKQKIARAKTYRLPHADIATKAHVLFPLLEIAPGLVVPGFKKALVELAVDFKRKPGIFRRLNIDPVCL
jgi:2-amino-4-hydroxy-6-hydroxymethyldihydropteridine diphosphokinase